MGRERDMAGSRWPWMAWSPEDQRRPPVCAHEPWRVKWLPVPGRGSASSGERGLWAHPGPVAPVGYSTMVTGIVMGPQTNQGPLFHDVTGGNTGRIRVCHPGDMTESCFCIYEMGLPVIPSSENAMDN